MTSNPPGEERSGKSDPHDLIDMLGERRLPLGELLVFLVLCIARYSGSSALVTFCT